ncbi:MAG: hypothetical protein ACYDA4_10115 [Ignavibacteriaceae bacterium]
MSSKINLMISSIVIEAACFMLIGWMFEGNYYIFNIHSSTFTYLIFGTASIILINILEYFSLRNFIYSAILFSFIFILAYFKYYVPLSLVRNFLWFVVISSSIYFSSKFLTQEKYRTRKFLGIAVWMINFAVVYLVMLLVNTYIFNFYPAAAINQLFIIAFNMGTSMGLGIGIGYEISKKYVIVKYAK